MKKIIEKIKNMNLAKFLIPIIIILIVLAVAQGLYSQKGISAQKAGEKAIDYINTYLLQEGITASLVEAKNESGVYSIKLKIEGQEYTSYITKDGKILFPQGYPISESTASEEFEVEKKDKPEADLFVMSFCPYGNTAEETMADVVGLLGDKADIQLHYVIYSNYQGGGSTYCLDKDNKYCSMHGIQELNQDVRELCVQKYQKDKLWDFIKAINAACGAGNVDACWENVAGKTGIDINKIKTCQKDEALALLENEFQLNEKYDISGSPQLIINDKEYQGDRSAEAYKSAICSGFKSAPKECSEKLGAESAAASGGCE